MRAIERLLHFLLLCLAIAAGCSVVGPEDERRQDLDDARDLWASRDLHAYEYRYTHQCGECLPAFARTYDVRVVNDVVVTVTDAETGAVPPEHYDPRSVPELFDLIDDAIGRAFVLRVEYDDAVGYPRVISVDYEEQVADDEFAIRVEMLRRLE